MDLTVQDVFGQIISVVSTDNQRWNKIEAGDLTFGAHVMAKAKVATDVKRVGLIHGQCGGTDCNGKPRLWSRTPWQREYENQMAVTFPSSQIPVSTTGIATVPTGDEIVRRCNAHLPPGGGNAVGATFDHLVPVTFVVDTTMERLDTAGMGEDPNHLWVGDVDGAITRYLRMKVVCKPFQREQAADGVATEQPQELRVGAITLDAIPTSAVSKPTPTTECKKGKLEVTLTTNKIGPVKFKLWTKIGDGPMNDKFVEAWAAHAGPGQYKAEYTQWVEVTKTSDVQAMAEDKTNPIGQSTGWKELRLACKDVTGGGFADVPNPHNPDNGTAPAPLKVTGELTLADGGPKDRPRLGQAVFKIWASKPGATDWKLTCSGGREWQGTLPTFKVGDRKYQAVGAANFQISKTEQIGCALRSMSLPNKDVIAVASELFELVKRNKKIDPADGLVSDPRPTPPTHQDRVPGIKVAPEMKQPPKLVCIGGKGAGVTCLCPPRTEKIQFGPHSYRCQVNVVTPRPGFEGPRPGFRPRPEVVGPRPGLSRPGFARPMGRPMHESAVGPRRFFR
jgi:hypothetical protein